MNWYKLSQQEEEIDPILPPQEEEEIPLPAKHSPYRGMFPNVRGGWNLNKIKRQLGMYSSSSGDNVFHKEVMRFSSPQEFEDNLYYHGTGSAVSGGLKAGYRQVRNGMGGGGGYGEKYYSISLSKDKNQASNFTGDSYHGTVYPVILKKDASIIEMPQLEDASQLEEILPKLWNRGIDAVKLGDWSTRHSEQELAVLNPRALHIGKGEYFPVFNKQRFDNPSMEEITQMWQEAGDKYAQFLQEKGKKPLYRTQQIINEYNENKNNFLGQDNELV